MNELQARGIARNMCRVGLAETAFRHAARACEFLLRNPNLPHDLVQTTWAGIVTLYSRPFTDNSGLGPVNLKIPAEHHNLHTLLVMFRNKLVAHNDIDACMEVRQGGLTQFRLVRKGNSWIVQELRILGGEPEQLSTIRDLADNLRQQCDAEEQRFFDMLPKPRSTDIDEFVINIADKKSALFQPVINALVDKAITTVYAAKANQPRSATSALARPTPTMQAPAEFTIPDSVQKPIRERG